MPVKFQLGIGTISVGPSSAGGTTTKIFSGTIRPGILGGATSIVQVTPTEIDPATAVQSQKSAVAFHSTLFEDFRISASAVYNFFVPDEQRTVHQNPSASLEDLPRYVSISWRPVPFRNIDIPVSRKGVRPQDPRVSTISPALHITSAKSSTSNGYVAPGSISALLVPPISSPSQSPFDEDGFLLDPNVAGQAAPNHFISGSHFFTPIVTVQDVRIRTSFIDPSIVGALDANRIAVAADHIHLASLGAVAKIMAGLEVVSEFNQDSPPRNSPPKFPISTDAPTLSYVGYVMERYTLDQSGSMTLTRTVDISDPSIGMFIDRDVAYGGSYAYRIRSIVQWTHPLDVTFPGDSTLTRLPVFNTSAPSSLKEASFYAGEWSDWSRTRVIDTSPPDPPDELTVQPRSSHGTIRIVWKMPADPQRDISELHLLRAKVTPDGTTDWVHILKSIPGNGAYDDHDVLPFDDGRIAYLYAMYSTSFHGETSKLSEQIEARIGKKNISEESPLREIRIAGRNPFAHASGLSDPDPLPLIAVSRATFYCRETDSRHPLNKRPYIIEVQSLSTGERAEVTLTTDSIDMGAGTKGPLRHVESGTKGLLRRA